MPSSNEKRHCSSALAAGNRSVAGHTDELAFDSFVSINSEPERAVARVVKSVVPKTAFAPVMSAATVQAKMSAASAAPSTAVTSPVELVARRALKEHASLADPAEAGACLFRRQPAELEG